MKSINFYTDTKRYIGHKVFKSWKDNMLEIRSWIDSGNYLKIDGELVNNTIQIVKYYN